MLATVSILPACDPVEPVPESSPPSCAPICRLAEPARRAPVTGSEATPARGEDSEVMRLQVAEAPTGCDAVEVVVEKADEDNPTFGPGLYTARLGACIPESTPLTTVEVRAEDPNPMQLSMLIDASDIVADRLTICVTKPADVDPEDLRDQPRYETWWHSDLLLLTMGCEP
ncbi:MAG: hypothetical protein KC613_10735 [Myxococcales bacterium]|nr:hypothetical protein [Myxococcales bacterium]